MKLEINGMIIGKIEEYKSGYHLPYQVFIESDLFTDLSKAEAPFFPGVGLSPERAIRDAIFQQKATIKRAQKAVAKLEELLSQQ